MVVRYCWGLNGLFLKLQDFIKSVEGRLLPIPREDMLAADTTEAACWVNSDKRMGKWQVASGKCHSIHQISPQKEKASGFITGHSPNSGGGGSVQGSKTQSMKFF